MGTMLNNAVSCSADPILYLKLAFTATFFAGVFQAALGLLRYWTTCIKFAYVLFASQENNDRNILL